MNDMSETVRLLRHIRLFCGIMAGTCVLWILTLIFPEFVPGLRELGHLSGVALAIAAVLVGFIGSIAVVVVRIGRSASPEAASERGRANDSSGL
jgi:hypothetical protein